MMWRLVREDRSLRFWRVLIFDPPTRRRRCNLSTFSVAPYAADYGTAVRAVAGRDRNRILCQLPDLYSSATPHSLRSYGVCSNSAAAHRFRFTTHSFNGYRCCPIPPLYKVLLAEPSRSVLHCEQDSYCHRLLPTVRCTRIIRLTAKRICRQWNTSANILRFALHGGQRHGSTSSDRSGSEQDIAPTP